MFSIYESIYLERPKLKYLNGVLMIKYGLEKVIVFSETKLEKKLLRGKFYKFYKNVFCSLRMKCLNRKNLEL